MDSNTRAFEPERRSEPRRISRRGRKISLPDDIRLLAVLPKDIPERLWAELFAKEEIDLIIFDIREEIIDNALDICYDDYMDRQSIAFTVHCVAKAWLQLVDWNFLRYDPGEDPTAYPPCDIPKRTESWKPDEMPEPSPKDSWANEVLRVVDVPIKTIEKQDSSSSLEYPELEPVTSEYWFPGKVELPGYAKSQAGEIDSDARGATGSASTMDIENEVLERITDYSKDVIIDQTPPDATPPILSGGGGDSVSKAVLAKPRTQPKKKDKIAAEQPKLKLKSKVSLPPLKVKQSIISQLSRSRHSNIFDRHRRSLRLDTQYEVTSEKVDSPIEMSPKKK